MNLVNIFFKYLSKCKLQADQNIKNLEMLRKLSHVVIIVTNSQLKFNYEFCRDVFNVSCQPLHMLFRGVLRLSIIRITKYFVHDRTIDSK